MQWKNTSLDSLPCFRKDKRKIALLFQVAEPNLRTHHEAMVEQDDWLDVVSFLVVLSRCRLKVGFKVLFLITSVPIVPGVISLLGLGSQGHTVFSQQTHDVLRWIGCRSIG